MTRRNLPLLAAIFLAGVLATLGGFFLLGRDHASAAGPGSGYGMMGSYGWGGMMHGNGSGSGPGMMGGGGPGYGGMMGSGGMMGGAFGGTVQTSITPAELRAVRDRVEKQLAASGYKGFTVGEIMAFTNNDYVLVKDASGKPAFELLADPKGRWLMPEPQSMMWNTSYGMPRVFGRAGNAGWSGMMGGAGCPAGSGATGSAGAVSTAAAAKTRADAWLAGNRPDAATADATTLPGYFTIDVTENGTKVGMLSVNTRTAAVWFHTWHGSFLADQDF